MFYYISGEIALKTDSFAVIDAGGVGYRLYASTKTLETMGAVGDFAKLYTYTNFKASADVFDIYGFATLEELNLFEMIIGVQRVGAKTALSLLSNISPSKFALCVVTNDYKYIASQTPGLGAKGAERIVLELKDKLSKGQSISASGEAVKVDAVTIIPQNKVSEASAALAVLGYSQAEISVALKGVDVESLSLEQIIRAALKNMVKG